MCVCVCVCTRAHSYVHVSVSVCEYVSTQIDSRPKTITHLLIALGHLLFVNMYQIPGTAQQSNCLGKSLARGGTRDDTKTHHPTSPLSSSVVAVLPSDDQLVCRTREGGTEVEQSLSKQLTCFSKAHLYTVCVCVCVHACVRVCVCVHVCVCMHSTCITNTISVKANVL